MILVTDLAAVAKLRTYAEDPAHFIDARNFEHEEPPIPGNMPEHVLIAFPFRLVYSITLGPCVHGRHPFHRFRMLSASIANPVPIARPVADPRVLANIAVHHFGFDTHSPSFAMGMDPKALAIVMVQDFDEPAAGAHGCGDRCGMVEPSKRSRS